MADYIMRQSIYKKIAEMEETAMNRYLCTPWDSPAKELYRAQLNERTALKHIIEDEQAANVRKDVHGKWEPGNQNCPVCNESKFNGLCVDIRADWKPPFCPNCGARMTGGGER